MHIEEFLHYQPSPNEPVAIGRRTCKLLTKRVEALQDLVSIAESRLGPSSKSNYPIDLDSFNPVIAEKKGKPSETCFEIAKCLWQMDLLIKKLRHMIEWADI